MTEYKPQKGDRVRVTIEGEVSIAHSSGYSGQKRVLLGVPGADSPQFWLNPEDPLVTVEKLADYNPEPVWVNGDLIEAGGSMFARLGGQWRDTETGDYPLSLLITNYWKAGMVEILYKADQPDGSSAVGKADAQKVA